MRLNKIKVLTGVLALSVAAISPSALSSVHNVYGAVIDKVESGWVLRDENWYYLYGDGREVKNDWVYHKGKWYYLGNEGVMSVGWTNWKGIWYYLNAPNGDMAVSAVTPDGYEVGEDGAWQEDGFNGLKKGEYPGLIVEAESEQAVRPGDPASVNIKLKNTGNKTVVFTHGSGSFLTPQSLRLKIPGLQPVAPRDYLGIATMDYQKDTLKPGEERVFEFKVRAVRFNDKFSEYAFSMYHTDNQYIGDISWTDLEKAHSDLEKASVGSYKGQVILSYSVLEEGAEEIFKDDTGFNIGEFIIDVKE